MFDLENAIKQWKKSLAADPGLEDGQRAELETCLRDEVADLIRRGLAPEDAFHRATAEMGGAGEIGDEFFKVYAKRRFGLPSWKRAGFSPALLWSYFKIALRKVKRQKGYSFINIAGLAVGMTGALFILLWIQNESSYDRFHRNAGTLYRIEQDQNYPRKGFHVSATPQPLGPALKDELPEVRDFARTAFPNDLLIRQGENAFYESNVFAVDPQFLSLFSFPLIKGDPATALVRPGSLVMTEAMAKKYFGDADPIGQTLTIDKVHPFTVTGVLKTLPLNSTLSFDMLVPFDFIQALGMKDDSMTNNNVITYVELDPRGDAAATAGKLTWLVKDRTLGEARSDPGLIDAFKDPKVRGEFEAYTSGREFSLMPLVDIRLHAHFGFSRTNRTLENVANFGAIALFVLLISGLNFMNLATARSAGRAPEIGLRKVVGAERKSIVAQLLGESVLSAFLAGAVSYGLVILLLPAFNALSGKRMTLGALGNGEFLLGILGVTLLTGLFAGSYPALFLSSFRPGKVLRGGLRLGAKNGLFRKTIVLLQFGLSILLLIGMGVVARQIDYMRNKSLGYDKEQLIYLPLRGDTFVSYAVLKAELLRNSRILGVTAAHQPPTEIGSNSWSADWDGKAADLKVLIGYAAVDFDFTETLKIPLVAGRPFSREMALDNGRSYLVNEKVPKLMGLDAAAAIGKRFDFRGFPGTIVGVMKDFHYQSVRDAIEPLAVRVDPSEIRFAVARLKAGEIPASLDDVKKTWRKAYPQSPFEYRFFDEDFDLMYRADERTAVLLKVFAGMAVVVACLGLFGLASFTAEQRTKEIGVRKVLGASSPEIVMLLSREFAKWVAAANLLAWPLAYFLMRNWLRKYAYNPGLAWWLFAAAGAGALAIALVTVSFQAVRAARANPAESLRHE